jgi:hypothetical protein
MMIARLIRASVGLASGIVVTTTYTNTQGLLFLLVVLSGFGVMHVPAAGILFSSTRGQYARKPLHYMSTVGDFVLVFHPSGIGPPIASQLSKGAICPILRPGRLHAQSFSS